MICAYHLPSTKFHYQSNPIRFYHNRRKGVSNCGHRSCDKIGWSKSPWLYYSSKSQNFLLEWCYHLVCDYTSVSYWQCSQFEAQEFQDFCTELHINHCFSFVGYPQTNGLMEVTNGRLYKVWKKRLDSAKVKWVDELLSLLWSYRTTPHSWNLENPFSLCFNTEALLPVELETPSTWIDNIF